MNPEKFAAWVELFGAAIPMGAAVVAGIKALASQDGMTDAQINEAETLAVADSLRRAAERDEMSKLSGDGG